jgi:hypothetical protein
VPRKTITLFWIADNLDVSPSRRNVLQPSICISKAPPNRGDFNSHVHGTHVPVEEPSTASYSITSWALASGEAGMVNPNALAVLRLMGHTSMSNLTPCASGSCIPKLTVLVARRI